MSKKYYSIHVMTAKPQIVEVGEINKTTGMPVGPTEIAESVVGRITIPNFSKIWAKREVNTKGEPTGKFTALPWGDPEGEVIEIRWMSNSPSLDKQYQELRKLTFSDQEVEITLQAGINHFDPIKDPTLVQMLQLHTYNADNKSRNPSHETTVYREYDPAKVVTAQRQQQMSLLDAMAVINGVSGDAARLHVLAAVYNVDRQIPDEDIVYRLVERAQRDPVQFLNDKINYMTRVQSVLYRAKDLQVISVDSADSITLAQTGEMVIGGFKKIADTKKLDYLVNNALEPTCHAAIEAIWLALKNREAQLS